MTYTWTIPTGNVITGSTYIKDTDNKIQDTMDDLADFVNSSGAYTGQGLMFDYVDKANNQTITGIKTFSNGIISNVTGTVTGNSGTTTKWNTARSITLTGDVTGTISGVDGSSNISIATSFALTKIISGMIIMWSGSQASIPSGWLLCNGSNGTPNLMDRFVIGAGNSYAVGATGGSKDAIVVSHNHSASSSVSDPGHVHRIYGKDNNAAPAGDNGEIANLENGGAYYVNSTSVTTGISVSTSVGSTGSSGTNANLPPYYALCFIMKA